MDILVLNENFEFISIIDHYKSLIWTERYSEAGDFEIYLSEEDALAFNGVQEGYHLMLPKASKAESIMIIEKFETNTDPENGDEFILTGRSLESLLERRIVWPQTLLSGDLQNGVQTLIDKNIVNPDDPSRAVSNFAFLETSDPRITELNLEAQFTGDVLYDAIKSICDSCDLGFRIILTTGYIVDDGNLIFDTPLMMDASVDGKKVVINDSAFTFTVTDKRIEMSAEAGEDTLLEFQLFMGEDRSYNQEELDYVVFSDKFENLISSNYFESKENLKTISYVAGEGEGADRKTTEVSLEGFGTETGWDRRELFVDARDISSTVYDEENEGDSTTIPDEEYIELLAERGREKLSEHKISRAFEGQVENGQTFTYGEDYFIGDVVQIVDKYGHEGTARVTEYVISISPSGIECYPTFTAINE